MTDTTRTVHDLASDWAWMDSAIGFRLCPNGPVWEVAEYGPRSVARVRIGRADITAHGLRAYRRYVSPSTPINTLVVREG